ncbi:hypothetical protein HPB47_021697, partial [Ixodes persulcatus]
AHFEESAFEQNRIDGWKKLKQTAIPTIFPTVQVVRRLLNGKGQIEEEAPKVPPLQMRTRATQVYFRSVSTQTNSSARSAGVSASGGPEERFVGQLMSMFIPSNAIVTRYTVYVNRSSDIAEEGKCRVEYEALSEARACRLQVRVDVGVAAVGRVVSGSKCDDEKFCFDRGGAGLRNGTVSAM